MKVIKKYFCKRKMEEQELKEKMNRGENCIFI